MSTERLGRYFSREVMLRLLASLGLALILWSFVTVQRDPETTKAFADVPVAPANLGNSLVIVSDVKPVDINLSGPESVIEPIEQSEITASVDLSDVTQPGQYEVDLEVEKPGGVWETDIDPKRAMLTIEKVDQREFELSSDVTDLDQSSLRSVDVTPEVERVVVSGPTSALDRIASVVLPVEVSGGTREFEEIFTPEARDTDGDVVGGVRIEPAAVSAKVSVSARGKSVAVLANITGSTAPGYEVVDRTINPQFVIVDGPEDLLDGLVALSTEPIDVTNADASFSSTVSITDLPPGVEVIQPDDGMVDVLVQIAQRGLRQSLPGQRVTILNLGNGLEVTVEPETVTIEVVAPEDALAGLDSESFQVLVDAAGLTPGSYTLQPSVIMPARVQWVASTPAEVKLTIARADSNATPSPVAIQEQA
jgi:YbbR domain-containing protein